MKWLWNFPVVLLRGPCGFLAWIVGGLGALTALVGLGGFYFAEYGIQTFSLLGPVMVAGSAIIPSKLTGL